MSELKAAIQNLIQTEAVVGLRIAKAEERMAIADERFEAFRQEVNQRFDRVERALAQILKVLELLPDSVREKIGFQPAKP